MSTELYFTQHKAMHILNNSDIINCDTPIDELLTVANEMPINAEGYISLSALVEYGDKLAAQQG